MLDVLAAGASTLDLLILDVCPIPGLRVLPQGLAPQAAAAPGTLIAYPTAPGTVASMGRCD